MRFGWMRAAAVLAGCTTMAACAGQGTGTKVMYLSGKGKDDPVKWDFLCSAGQHAGQWSTIGVPSNWELQGYGIYSYGKEPRPNVEGQYERTFTVPASWVGKRIFLAFAGVMTDTEASVNGQVAGPVHQGGYYPFKYEITKLVKVGGENRLEVRVDAESANASVNRAERNGDYWNYAGIFRPVTLEAMPPEFIDHVAIDGQADGSLAAEVAVDGEMVGAGWTMEGQVVDAAGKPVGDSFSAPVESPRVRLVSKVSSPALWTAETPNLYTLQLRLKHDGKVIHSMRQRFGFRTIEVRPGEGLFVNGKRIMFKGADRHSFWPDSGRCLSPAISVADVAIMKSMNMNAVRMSHYPPDAHFLDACDAMGMYVLDELAGWHAHYDTAVGKKLVKEMVERDANHPCILFWDNGNEGGWNTALDGEFAKYDLQQRLVLHPWAEHPIGMVDTKHYPDYATLQKKLAGTPVFFPTEMLHGLYDGGAGAGLEDYWNAMRKSKVSAGGIIWALLDEDVVRTDGGGKLDSHGNNAPDGILGPYRGKEGSYYTIKQLWSPIVIHGPATLAEHGDKGFTVENRYSFTNARQCGFTWELWRYRSPFESRAGHAVVASGKGEVGSIAPGETGPLTLHVPASEEPRADSLAITAKDPQGRTLWTWVFPISPPEVMKRNDSESSRRGEPQAIETSNAWNVSAGDLRLRFSRRTGELEAVSRGGKPYSLTNGLRLVTGDATFSDLTRSTAENGDILLTAHYTGDLNQVTYRIGGDGWMTIDYAYHLTGPHPFFGMGFDYPEEKVQGMRYLGDGPSTVYQNRLAGGMLDVWEKKYNDTIVGDPESLPSGARFNYPIFKGYYAGMRWLQLETTEGPITVEVKSGSPFVQVFTPRVPPKKEVGQTGVPFPEANVSFLDAIPAIGSKFTPPKKSGPQSQPAEAHGDYHGSIRLYFGEP